jgi:hypothetical protein
MKKLLTPLLATLLVGCQQASTGANLPVDVTEDNTTAVPIEVVPIIKWTCPTCTDNEKYVLKQLQEKTRITDRNALATIMGNIKQESKFYSNICEGGTRVPYSDCHRGGYGLIQWTSTQRHLGLGYFAKKYGCDPSTLECQTRYMINEPIFQRYLPEFEGSDQSIAQYMVPSYYWLGWGIKGSRETYSHQYRSKLLKP